MTSSLVITSLLLLVLQNLIFLIFKVSEVIKDAINDVIIIIFSGSEHTVGYEEIDLNLDSYTGKSILILGSGNAAFETADHLLSVANHIHLISMKLQIQTKSLIIEHHPMNNFRLK